MQIKTIRGMHHGPSYGTSIFLFNDECQGGGDKIPNACGRRGNEIIINSCLPVSRFHHYIK